MTSVLPIVGGTTEATRPRDVDLSQRRVFWPMRRTSAGGWPDRSIRLTALVDLDVATEQRARAELGPLCSDGGDHRRIVVVIGERCFVDVRGLAVLLDAARLARLRNRKFTVVDTVGNLRKALAALQLEDQLTVVPALSEFG